MEKPNISFFAMNFVLLFALVGFILVIFELHRFAFVLELGILLIFLSIFAFAVFVIYKSRKWGWTALSAALILLMINIFFIYALTREFETAHATVLFFSLIGIVIAALNLKGASHETIIEAEAHDRAKDYHPYIDKMEPEEQKAPSVEKTFTPGKFIASKKASKFHTAKCDWAKRIGRENQLWFDSEEEAKAQGFQADGCVG